MEVAINNVLQSVGVTPLCRQQSVHNPDEVIIIIILTKFMTVVTCFLHEKFKFYVTIASAPELHFEVQCKANQSEFACGKSFVYFSFLVAAVVP